MSLYKIIKYKIVAHTLIWFNRWSEVKYTVQFPVEACLHASNNLLEVINKAVANLMIS